MRGLRQLLPRLFFLAFLGTGLLIFSGGPLCPVPAAAEEESAAQVDKMLAELSDEQVRQLLIEELKKDAAVAEAEPDKMKGPAFFLARLLGIMTKEHDDNTEEVRALFGTLDTMVPDLYRVFVKL